MRRIISPKRVAALLKPHGFALAVDVGDSSILYARPSEVADLWEQVRVTVAGRHGEAVGANVGVSVRYGFVAGRGLFESRAVPETCSANEDFARSPPNLKRLRDHEEAILWERLVADICPERARAFAREMGPGLLARTADARHAVGRYLELFGTRDWRQLRTELVPRATRPELMEAERIASTPPMVEIRNGFEFYATVVLGIMLFSDQVEGRQIIQRGAPVFPEHEPYSKPPADWSGWSLVWRIDILADRMLARYPEMMSAALSG